MTAVATDVGVDDDSFADIVCVLVSKQQNASDDAVSPKREAGAPRLARQRIRICTKEQRIGVESC